MADIAWIDHFSKYNLECVAPFVASVTFIPPLYNWHVDEELFHRLITDSRFDLRLWSRDPPKPSGAQRCEHTETEVQAAWHRYETFANRNYDLLCDRSSLWVLKLTKWLKMLPKCQDFCFSLVDYANLDENLNPNYPECLQYWLGGRERFQLAYNSGDMADMAFGLALEALKRVGSTIHAIRVDNPTTGGNLWCSNLRDDALNLTQLRSVQLTPTFEHGESGYDDEISAAFDKEMQYLISRCASSIESIYCIGFDVWVWDSTLEVVQPMPHLRSLCLGPSWVPSHYITTWLSASTQLAELTLHSFGIGEEEEACNWKMVFDAIRTRSGSLNLDLELYLWDNDVEVGQYRTRMPRSPTSEQIATVMHNGENCFMAIARVLPFYFDELVDWTGVLAQVFCVGEPDWEAARLLQTNHT